MKEFYDVHCHILPGMDDGAEDMDDAIKMLKISREEGIGHIILTPHYHVGHYEHSTQTLLAQFELLKKQAAREFPDMTLYLGSEICYHFDVVERLARGQILSIADTDYVLVEFYPNTDSRMIKNGLREIQMSGKQPILAHVERYKALLGQKRDVNELIEMGVCIQVNSGAIVGREGFWVKQFTRKLLEYEMVHFIGTDAHGWEKRKPAMRECAAYIEKKWGSDYMEELLIKNPKKMLSGSYF